MNDADQLVKQYSPAFDSNGVATLQTMVDVAKSTLEVGEKHPQDRFLEDLDDLILAGKIIPALQDTEGNLSVIPRGLAFRILTGTTYQRSSWSAGEAHIGATLENLCFLSNWGKSAPVAPETDEEDFQISTADLDLDPVDHPRRRWWHHDETGPIH